MLKWALRVAAVLAIVLVVAFLVLRTPDTDPAAMRAKYGGPPSQFVTLPDGREVHVRDEGPRNAPAIVLLHGSNSDLHTWEPWAEALRNNYRVVRFDQRGHGLTGPAPDRRYDRAAFAADVDAVADALGLGRFVLGGNSMGGWVTLAYALDHGDRLDGIVLLDAAGAPELRETQGNIGFAIAQTPGASWLMTQVTPRSLVESSLRQSVSNAAIVTPEAVDRYWELLRYPGNRQATVDRFSTRDRTPYTDAELGSIDVPALIIWGDEDALIPVEAADWFAERLPRSAPPVVYPGIGHLPMEEAAERSVADLQLWLDTLRENGAEAIDGAT
ncbi:alpha/beta hydrolase [Qipengyuania sp. JC766]|uniref:alpha/beta fold hydrolase n=1 Tax=Qipengyuania sp. JC766 TaxID=3232139 RepID=UPI003458CE57